jgi:bifunctional DNA-binding transcriptional regulator/antitoxin component of YhaV-PrlF toxin-antitoxin module
MTQYTCTVDEDGVLTFSDELMEQMGWKEGDTLEFRENPDGSFYITKIKEETNGTV